MSFETSGIPEAECAPEMTQLLEPARQSRHCDVLRAAVTARRSRGAASEAGGVRRDCVLSRGISSTSRGAVRSAGGCVGG